MAHVLRAVRVLRRVVEHKEKLEVAWVAESRRLSTNDKRVLRDVCSGTLRHLEYYSRLIDFHAVAQDAEDVEFRLLAASTLYQSEHMVRAPSPAALREAAAECCAELQKPVRSASAMSALLHTVTQMGAGDRARALTPAASASLPPWLFSKLDKPPHNGLPLRDFAPLLLERPNTLGLCVSPAAYGGRGRDGLLAELRRQELEASACAVAPNGILLHARPRDVAALPGMGSGLVHVQDAVQQLGPSLLRRLPAGARVLDATAAPGGKSRALLYHQPHIRLVAVEHNRRKIGALRESLSAAAAATSKCVPPLAESAERRSVTGSPTQRAVGQDLKHEDEHEPSRAPVVLLGDAAEPASWYDHQPSPPIHAEPCSRTRALPHDYPNPNPTPGGTANRLRPSLSTLLARRPA